LQEAEKAGGSLTKEQERQFNRYTDKIKSINESINEELLNIRTSEPILITPQKAVSPIEESKTPVTKPYQNHSGDVLWKRNCELKQQWFLFHG